MDKRIIEMIHGTPNFESFQAAVNYYKNGYYKTESDAIQAVTEKLKDKEIYIGAPEINENQAVTIDKDERRYKIITYKADKADKAKQEQPTTIIQSIKTMVVKGNRLELNPEIKMVNYSEVKNVLSRAGGVYNKNGFEFKSCAKEIYNRLISGEKIDDKKKFQFFETPEKIVNKLHSLLKIKDTDKILEPSAGKGRLLKGLNKENIHCVELMEDNKKFLLFDGFKVIGDDFLRHHIFTKPSTWKYDIILANPPFAKNQDIDHFIEMQKFIKKGGQIACIMSTHWINSSTKKCKDFRSWLEEKDHDLIMIPAGEFKQSGTAIATCIIHLRA